MTTDREPSTVPEDGRDNVIASESPEPAATKPRLPWWKRLLFCAVACFLALMVILVGLEITLRLGSWQIKSLHHIGSLYRYHPTLGRELIPEWEVTVAGAGQEILYRVNRHGFRDPDDTPPARSPGMPRIAVIGDSLTWGWGVEGEQTVSERLEELTRVEAINMGMNACGTGEEWLLLRERGLAFQPDIVLLLFFVGNDYRNNLSRSRKKPHFDLDDQGRIVVSNVPVPRPMGDRVSAFAKRNFLSYFFIGYHVGKARTAIKYSPRWYGRAYRALTTKKERIKRGEVDLDMLDGFRLHPRPEQQRAEVITEALLEELGDSCAAAGARLLVSVLPDRLQIQERTWRALLGGASPAPFDRNRPTRVCLEMCARLGIRCVDLLPVLQSARQDGKKVYLPNDIHLNAEGHRLAAGVICEELQRLGWLPRER